MTISLHTIIMFIGVLLVTITLLTLDRLIEDRKEREKIELRKQKEAADSVKVYEWNDALRMNGDAL